MTAEQFTLLIHPTLVVISVFPLIGIVCYFAWETRQRRLQIKAGEKVKFLPLWAKTMWKLGNGYPPQ